jgi:dihydrolipoamide dehydrogenase
MSGSSGDAVDLLVVGAGPAGVMAALRAAYLGTRTTLLTSGDFGGMAANDGPVPIRTLAHVARLLREARQLGRYGVAVGEPVLNYPRLLERVREVVGEVAAASSLRPQIDAAGVVVRERLGAVRFVEPGTVATEADAIARRGSSCARAGSAADCRSPASSSPPPTATPGR